MATLLPEGKQSFNDSAGAPLVGGKVYTYDAGTSTPRTTYADAAATVPNTNPVILDARGEATIFWSGAYKVVLKDTAGVTIWSVDNIVSLDIVDIGAQPKFSASVAVSIGGYPVGYVLQDNAGLNSYVNIVAANTTDFNTTPASIGVSWIPYSGQTATQVLPGTSVVATGTVDVITAVFSPAITVLTNGLMLRFRPTGANTAVAPTLTVNGTPAKTIVKGVDNPLVAADIAGAGAWAVVQYDSTLDKWVLLNPAMGVSLLSLFGASITANGWQKLPSGLIMQWGTSTANTGFGVIATFPISFPTSCVFAGIGSVGSPGGDVEYVQISAKTQTNLSGATYISIESAISTGSLTFSFFALGY